MQTDSGCAMRAGSPGQVQQTFQHWFEPSWFGMGGPVIGRSAACLVLAACAVLTGCHGNQARREAAEAPPATPIVIDNGSDSSIHVENAALFPLAPAQVRSAFQTLNATGTVQPDISREVPVLSIANGRVVALHVTLGNYVHKGELVMEVQSPDVTQAFLSYQTALANEALANTILTRDKLLFDKGAIAKSLVDIAQNAEQDAKAALNASEQELRLLGVDKNHPSDTTRVYAPISGIVVAQNTTAAGAAGINLAGVGGSLTIADLSHVWVVCDVYENDLSTVRVGEQAEIRLSAFPDKLLTGTISDIGTILDPSIRTAKVRIQVANPGNFMRVGMFATATFRGAKAHDAITVPGNAVLHLHDRDFVYIQAAGSNNFRRVGVRTGQVLPGNAVEILSGLDAGQQVVSNALELQNSAGQ